MINNLQDPRSVGVKVSQDKGGVKSPECTRGTKESSNNAFLSYSVLYEIFLIFTDS